MSAVALIRESRGGHFDPDVVDAFFDCLDEVLSIKARYRDADMPEPEQAPAEIVIA